MPILEVRTSPHVHSPMSVAMIMRNVIWALLPVCSFGVWLFGLSALAVLITTTLTCVLIEHLACKVSGRPTTVTDGSSVITGLLLGLILPPALPIWIAAVAAIVAVAPGKLLFGGLGFNVFNPALVGRAFLQAAFPAVMTTYTPAMSANRFTEFIPSTWALPLMKSPPLGAWLEGARVDAFSGATPLMLRKFEGAGTDFQALFTGIHAGSIGETAVPLILLCGLYLVLRKMMDWRIPVAMIGAAMLITFALHRIDAARFPDAAFFLFTGGLVLGAVFMATDPVAAPVTPIGRWIYGSFMGLMTAVIRVFAGLPEGVMYAILLGNAISPFIDNLTQAHTYGGGGHKGPAVSGGAA